MLGPFTDIPAPDIYTDEQTMAWIYYTYDVMNPDVNNQLVVTGKSLYLGGSYGRNKVTGQGCLYATERFLSKGLIEEINEIAGARVVIQGFGNVGSVAADLFSRHGAKIVALSDSTGGIYAEEGLNLDEAVAFKREHDCVIGMPGTLTITNEELIATECDILIPAAITNRFVWITSTM